MVKSGSVETPEAKVKRYESALRACLQTARVLQLHLAGIIDMHPNVGAASDCGWEVECYADDALRGEPTTSPAVRRKPK